VDLTGVILTPLTESQVENLIDSSDEDVITNAVLQLLADENVNIGSAVASVTKVDADKLSSRLLEQGPRELQVFNIFLVTFSVSIPGISGMLANTVGEVVVV
jgi:hypothetical protein